MAEIVRMPKMSDTMTEGVLAKWHKKVGDKVKVGDLIAEIETDKATMDFESFQEGVLLHIGLEEGSALPVDAIIAVIGKEGEAFDHLLADNVPAAAPAATSAPEPVIAAPVAVATASTPVAATPVQVATAPTVASSEGRIVASPLAKKIAQEKGIDLNQVSGSAEGGRIIKKDVEDFNPSTAAAPRAAIGVESFEEVPVSQMRKVIARRLSESMFTAPHFYLKATIRMDKAMEARKAINEIADRKISFNDMVLKAVAVALTRHPNVNSSWLGDKIRYNHHINIGVAVAVEDGLLVPVVRFANNKSLSQISLEVADYAARAKAKKLQPSDWEGSTFTISNLGMFGIDEFTAIINPPDACILAIGGIKEVPVVSNGAIVVGNEMKVTLSCDHRVVDGATGAAFLSTLKQMLEEPVRLLA